MALKEDAKAAGREVQVGIVKDLFQFHAFGWYNIVDHFLAWLFNKLFNQVPPLLDHLAPCVGRVLIIIPCMFVVKSTVR